MRIIFLIILCIPLLSAGQDWSSLQNFGGSGFSQGVKIRRGEAETVYVAGHLQNNSIGKSSFTVLCDTLESLNNEPFTVSSFIIKYDNNNSIIWKRNVPGRIEDFTIDDNANCYVVGYFEYTLIINGEPYYPLGFGEGYALKYNNQGDIVWIKILTGDQFNRVNNVAISKVGDIILSGINNSQSVFLPNTVLPTGSFVAKLDPSNGQINASKIFSTEQLWVSTITVDDGDNIILGGTYEDEVIFNNELFTSQQSSHDGFIAKLDNGLNEIWFKSIGSSNIQYSEEVKAIKSDETGYYFSGIFIDKITIDSHELESKGEIDTYVAKLNLNGELDWINNLGGESRERIFDLSINESFVCVTGEYSSEIEFPDKTLTPLGYSDIIVVKYLKNGEYVDSYTGGGSLNESDFLYTDIGISILVDEQSDIYVTGKLSGPGYFSNISYKVNGSSDYFIGIISEDKEVKSFEKYDCEYSNPMISIYPNPTNGEINIVSDNTILGLSIIDTFGRKISSFNSLANYSQMDISQLSSGLYFFNFSTKKGQKYIRVIKN